MRSLPGYDAWLNRGSHESSTCEECGAEYPHPDDLTSDGICQRCAEEYDREGKEHDAEEEHKSLMAEPWDGPL